MDQHNVTRLNESRGRREEKRITASKVPGRLATDMVECLAEISSYRLRSPGFSGGGVIVNHRLHGKGP